MKWLGVVLVASVAFAQQPAQNPPAQAAKSDTGSLLHLERRTFPALVPGDGYGDDCIVVARDGRFHMEAVQRSTAVNGNWSRVVEGTLTAEELAQLTALLDSAPIKALRVSDPVIRRTFKNHQDFLHKGILIQIRRDGEKRTQAVRFVLKKTYQKHEKDLQPLLEWFWAMQRRDMPETKGLKPDSCTPPEADLRPLPQ